MLKNDYLKEVENTLKLVREEVDKDIIKGDIEEAKKRINKELKGLIGLDKETIDLFSFEGICEFIDRGQEFNEEKYIALGVLLLLEGKLSKIENKENDEITYYEKSLSSFYKVYEDDEVLGKKYIDDAIETSNELIKYNLSIEMDQKIFRIYELNGSFDKAENTLFYMLRKSGNDKMIILDGMKFYNRLKKLDYEELIQGNLPIEEVEDGISELERRLGI